MNILVADDDPTYRHLLCRLLKAAGHDTDAASDGVQAWQKIEGAARPLLAILDWTMPAPDGLELCRRVRRRPAGRHVYAILLTGRTEREDVLRGLESGADDYITKPCDPQELVARVRIGQRMLKLQQSLATRVGELEAAMTRVKQLQGLLPMCSYCKAIRSDEDYWQKVEQYMAAHTGAQFSHRICPPCYTAVIAPQLQAARDRASAAPLERTTS
ncbi:MAG: response regulator transcription factor [Gemmataceae bacterium]